MRRMRAEGGQNGNKIDISCEIEDNGDMMNQRFHLSTICQLSRENAGRWKCKTLFVCFVFDFMSGSRHYHCDPINEKDSNLHFWRDTDKKQPALRNWKWVSIGRPNIFEHTRRQFGSTGSDDTSMHRIEWFAIDKWNRAACFGYNNPTGCNIPRPQIFGGVAINDTSGHITKCHSRRSKRTMSVRNEDEANI